MTLPKMTPRLPARKNQVTMNNIFDPFNPLYRSTSQSREKGEKEKNTSKELKRTDKVVRENIVKAQKETSILMEDKLSDMGKEINNTLKK